MNLEELDALPDPGLEGEKGALLEQIHAQIRGYNGITYSAFLWDVAIRCNQGGIVEIGCAMGRSSIAMATASKRGNKVKVYAIDPILNEGGYFGELWNSVTAFNVEDIVIPMRATSEQARKEFPNLPIELLVIDGDHKYNYVKMDLEMWTPLMVKGGIMIMDDHSNVDVKRAIDEDVPRMGFSKISGERHLWHAEKE